MKAAVADQIDAPMILRAQTAADLMVPNPISLRAEAGTAEASTLFTEKGITAAPVIDKGGRPIGVVSRSDLLIHHCEHVKHRPGEPDYFFAPRNESAPTGAETPTAENYTVADLMTPRSLRWRRTRRCSRSSTIWSACTCIACSSWTPTASWSASSARWTCSSIFD